jgi:hypothetical protein
MIDFHGQGRVDFLNVSFALSQLLWFARPITVMRNREAGEKPALPRNCKRGNL